MSKEGSCITAKMKKDRENLSWQEKYYREHKLRQEAEKENKELKEDNKKISRQIEDRIDRMRKSGM